MVASMLKTQLSANKLKAPVRDRPARTWRLLTPLHPAWSVDVVAQRVRPTQADGAGVGVRSTGAADATSSRDSGPAPYKWSWQEDTQPAVVVDVDAALVDAAASISELTAALRAAGAAAPPRAALATASRQQLAAAVQQLLPSDTRLGAAACSVSDAARLLEAYGAVNQGAVAGAESSAAAAAADAPPRLVALVLSYLCGSTSRTGSDAALLSASAQDLTDFLWALSELPDEELPWEGRAATAAAAAAAAPPVAGAAALEAAVAAAAPRALQRAVLARVRDQDFLAPELCRVMCALGSLAVSPVATAAAAATVSSAAAGAQVSGGGGGGGGGGGFSLDREMVGALNEEVRYQLTEFDADFSAADLGRLISGMAGLRLGAAVAADEEYRRILMKAVYGKTRSIADKAAVDFALSRLMSDDPEARSMHYDSRWTHEELRWLPRRERDKRRILKEGWYRTKWGGWSPGGDGRAA